MNTTSSQNLTTHNFQINRQDRERLNGHSSKVLWFTGLSGSGKSTLANALEQQLHLQGFRTYVLDGDNVRQGLNKDLGFSESDRIENIRRIAEVANLMMDAGLIVLTAFISPFRKEREMARTLIGADRFFEIYLNAQLSVCEGRDPKGLYAKARQGKISNMTGITSPYEPPESPWITLDSGEQSLDDEISTILNKLNTA
jgi:bifunctional enzyme CysN/CysC